MQIEVFGYDFLPFLERTKSNPSAVSASDTLIITQFGRTQIYQLSVHDSFNVGNSIRLRTSIYHVSVSDHYEVHHQGAKGSLQQITEGLFLWDTSREVKYDPRTDNITFVDTISFDKCKGITDTFTLTESAIFVGVYRRSSSDDLDLSNSANYYILDKYSCGITITPFTGPNAPEC